MGLTTLREKISARMQENSPKIWERLEVVDAWADFSSERIDPVRMGVRISTYTENACKVNVTGGMVQ